MDTATPTLSFCLFSTALGVCGVAWRGQSIIATRLPDTDPARIRGSLAKRTGGEEAPPPEPIQQAIEAIKALFGGNLVDLGFIDCHIDAIEPLALRVYEITRAIPAGQTRAYGDIAHQLGDKSLSRHVGRALGRNPLPIIVPCHRVLGANGKLTEFSASGGVKTKLRMLEIERARIGEDPGLFEDLPFAVKPASSLTRSE